MARIELLDLPLIYPALDQSQISRASDCHHLHWLCSLPRWLLLSKQIWSHLRVSWEVLAEGGVCQTYSKGQLRPGRWDWATQWSLSLQESTQQDLWSLWLLEAVSSGGTMEWSYLVASLGAKEDHLRGTAGACLWSTWAQLSSSKPAGICARWSLRRTERCF